MIKPIATILLAALHSCLNEYLPQDIGHPQFEISAINDCGCPGLCFAVDKAIDWNNGEEKPTKRILWPLKLGGWRLASTLDDYMRFARMLLNGGELDGVRILESDTVDLMATDMLPDTVTDKSWLPGKGQAGFGINFAVRLAPPADGGEASGAVGEFFWDGAANTMFWVDPKNDIAAVLFTQYQPYGGVSLHKDFRDAVYWGYPEASALAKPE